MSRHDTFQTGYYAGFRPDGGVFSTKVHVLKNGKAICGYRKSARAQWHWCARYIQRDFVNCPTCIKRLDASKEASPRKQVDLLETAKRVGAPNRHDPASKTQRQIITGKGYSHEERE